VTKDIPCTWNRLSDGKETERGSRKLWRKSCHTTFKLKLSTNNETKIHTQIK
jgi:hypothetical protein